MKMLEWIMNKIYKTGFSEIEDESSKEPVEELKHDVSVAKLEDDGSVYLLCLDWVEERFKNVKKLRFLNQSVKISLIQQSKSYKDNLVVI